MKYVLLVIVGLLFSVGCVSSSSIEDHRIFLEKNRNAPGVIVTGTGLQYEVLREGVGPKPKANSKVTLHYVGKNIDGSEFDNTYSRGEPPSFLLGGVILGLVEGVQIMEVGSKYRFVVPAELGYGDKGAGREIKPNATLIYEVELLDVE